MKKDKISFGIDIQNFQTGQLPESGHEFLISSSPTLTDIWKSKARGIHFYFNE